MNGRLTRLLDNKKEIVRTYDTLGILGLSKRVTYLIDPEGMIRDRYFSGLRPGNHVNHMKTKLQELAERGS